jgi:hypothetical protein
MQYSEQPATETETEPDESNIIIMSYYYYYYFYYYYYYFIYLLCLPSDLLALRSTTKILNISLIFTISDKSQDHIATNIWWRLMDCSLKIRIITGY